MNPYRIAYIGGGGFIGGVLLLMVMNFIWSPVSADRTYLASELDNIISVPVSYDPPNWRFSAWQEQIHGKPGLWEALVPPPPPPPPKPPPPPQKPDLNKMLEGIKAGLASIGGKARIITPENQRGEFLGVGERVKGLTIKSIERDSVTFAYFWEEGGEELTVTIPRER